MMANRYHHQLIPNEVIVDFGVSQDIVQDLISRGHEVKPDPLLQYGY